MLTNVWDVTTYPFTYSCNSISSLTNKINKKKTNQKVVVEIFTLHCTGKILYVNKLIITHVFVKRWLNMYESFLRISVIKNKNNIFIKNKWATCLKLQIKYFSFSKPIEQTLKAFLRKILHFPLHSVIGNDLINHSSDHHISVSFCPPDTNETLSSDFKIN